VVHQRRLATTATTGTASSPTSSSDVSIAADSRGTPEWSATRPRRASTPPI
jgi:hypothetical protein